MMNSTLNRIIGVAACIFAGSVQAAAPVNTSAPHAPGTRIGTYDSRSIAVAYAGSAAQRAVMDPLKAAFQKAKQEGNQAEMDKLQAQGRALQEQAHRQGFGTAPVDDLLEKIADALPEIRRVAGVSARGPVSPGPPGGCAPCHRDDDLMLQRDAIGLFEEGVKPGFPTPGMG